VAQGGDWGSLVTSWLALDCAPRVVAIHLTMMGLRPYLGEGSPPLTAEEQAWVDRTRARLARETGYQVIQGTKPQTLACALNDSPAGLAAWIAEKFHGWSEPRPEGPPFTLEQIVTNVMVYWLTGSAASASWLYTAARRLGAMRLARGERVAVPTGFLCPPHDLFPAPPDTWIARVYDCVHRTTLPAGGHFLAYERPDDFVADVRAFFRRFR
jgi:microsomal epoxide hydrolase